jgi:hypothetical protein
MPLTVNLGARVQDEILNGWLAGDTRFRCTWFRQRSELADQSQSGYDLALANFGVDAGLAEQQIVDLIVHHRAIHKQKSRTRLDYYYRTISKAADRGGRTVKTPAAIAPRTAPSCALPTEAGPTSPTPATSPMSDRDRIALCDQISAKLGIKILRIVKLSGQEPTYRMELPEGKIHFDSVSKLISQTAVRNAVAGRVGTLIPPFKPGPWRDMAQSLLDACVVEEGSEELEFEGAAGIHIEQYLAETPFIASIDGRSPQDRRKPMLRDGRITVCASDFQLFLNKANQLNLSVKAVAAMLSTVGAKTVRVRHKRHKEQSRWALPIEEFDPADYLNPRDGASEIQ